MPDKNRSIDLYFPSGQECRKNLDGKIETYNLLVRSICDSKADTVKVDDYEGFDSCNPKITISSKYGCVAYTYSDWVKEIGMPKYIVASFLLFLGLIFLIFGYQFKLVFGLLLISLAGGVMLFSLLNESLNYPIYCK